MSAYSADSDWKLHPIFDEEVTHVIETPDYVYFTSKNSTTTSAEAFQSLFRYDKKGEELMSLSSFNILNGNNVRDVIYNPYRNYLLVLYNDYNIDLIANNGKVSSIPAYAMSSITYSKNVNSMAVDVSKERVYLATDFGYLALNDKKNEVAESRIYGEPLKAFARIGNFYVAAKGDQILEASIDNPRLSLDQYNIVTTISNPLGIFPLSENIALLFSGTATNQNIKKLTATDSGIKIENIGTGIFFNKENIANGLIVAGYDNIYRFNEEGAYDTLERPEGFKNSAATTTNMSEIWNGLKRKGLCSVKKTGDSWSITRDWMLPNAPSPFVSNAFVNHPTHGFLMSNYGYDPVTYQIGSFSISLISGYKQGRWKNYSPAYTNPDRTNILFGPNGLAVDPDNSKYIYVSSYHNGFARFNLEDPNDIIHIHHSKDKDAGNDGFVVYDYLYPSDYANMTAPYFDAKGNLWICFTDGNDREEPNPHYLCWLAEDRRATTSSKDIKLPKHVEFDIATSYTNLAISIPLLKTGNGIQVYTYQENNTSFMLLDPNGTPSDMSDDKIYPFTRFEDTDGNELSFGRVRYLWEDPSTGYVWVAHGNGVCYFVPSKVLSGNYQFTRIKVPRNDGTNLADYLLDGVAVNQITEDGDGRKWFATSGGGVICTSADGREILEEFNTSNSLLPSDEVIGVGYNSENNSLMFSTSLGYAEYQLPSTQNPSGKADVRAYPNPVRPEFSGYVTITDIPQGSFVKITDSAGNLVKELGVMTGFEMLWDVSDYKFNRVKSGVYHILVSPSDENSTYSAVGKILVVS